VRKQNYDDRIEHFDAFYAHVGNFKSAEERAGYGGVVETTYARSLLRACYRLKKLGPICSKSI
jgi:hypothetical protein